MRAFGTTQVFDNVTSITGDFGDGNDQLILGDGFGTYRGMPVTAVGGTGDDILWNQSRAAATFRGGAGRDLLLSDGTADNLDGGADGDELYGSAESTLLGGDGGDTIPWRTALGRPAGPGPTATSCTGRPRPRASLSMVRPSGRRSPCPGRRVRS